MELWNGTVEWNGIVECVKLLTTAVVVDSFD